MFRELLDLFRRGDLITQAVNDSYTMIQECHEMFTESVKSLHLENTSEVKVDIYAKDKQVNKYEREVRKKVFTHLTVCDKAEISGALVLVSIIIDIERIGDYTKNIMDLALNHPSKLKGAEYQDELHRYEALLDKNFGRLLEALKTSNADIARSIMEEHKAISRWSDAVDNNIIQNKVSGLTPGDAAALALYVRFLKRIAGHMRNIASSIVNPFYRIGYKEKKEESVETAESKDSQQ